MIAATLFACSSELAGNGRLSDAHPIDAHAGIDSHVVTVDASTHHAFAALPLTRCRRCSLRRPRACCLRVSVFAPPIRLSMRPTSSSRFFCRSDEYFQHPGPNIDGSITQMNMFASQNPNNTCLSQTPVEYDLTPFGTTVPFYHRNVRAATLAPSANSA